MPREQEEPLNKEQYAFLPGGPYTPNKAKIRKDGMLIGMVIFFVVPFLIEFIDNRVKSPWDVEVFLGKDLVGGIPRFLK